MSAVDFEAFLARIYVDADERARFLTDPRAVAAAAGLSAAECDALVAIDREGLKLAAEGLACKRAQTYQSPKVSRRVMRWLLRQR
jgi:hypothetical protein